MLLPDVTFLILIFKNLAGFLKEKVQVFIESTKFWGLTGIPVNLSL